MSPKPKNPLSFVEDLTREELTQLSVYTQFARNRLSERDISVGELKRKFLAGEKTDRPPLLLGDFPFRLMKPSHLAAWPCRSFCTPRSKRIFARRTSPSS